jgi:hypothetical protein
VSRGVQKLRYLFFLLLLLAFPGRGYAEVFVHDMVAVSREEVMIKVETKKGYFRKGGQIVEFSINGKSAGRVLFGGDGVAYKIFRTGKTGMHTVSARYGKEAGNGSILVLKKGKALVFIDIEGSLLAGPFAKKPISSSREIIKKIMNAHPVVYLHTGTIGIREVKAWLRKNKFPVAPVVPWQMGEVFDALHNKGLRVKAVVGSQAVIDSASAYNPAGFGFDEQGDSGSLKAWQEIEKQLK